LKVTGQSTGNVGYAYFTDSQPQSVTFSSSSQNVEAGESAAYIINVDMVGNTNNCTLIFAITGLPSGTSATFSGDNPFTTNNTDCSKDLIISTETDVSPGTYPFTMIISRENNCQENGNWNGTGTVFLMAPSCTPPNIAG